MRVQEAFVVAEPPGVVWEFFEHVDRVARCVPGVEEVEVVDAEHSRMRVTQALGPMSATFDLKMHITERRAGQAMEFTAVGRSVNGAVGNVRSRNAVRLEPLDDGGTRVVLDADVALGGMIGSVGQKVVAKQASKVTRSFAEALERELRGEVVPAPVPPPAPEREAPIAAEPTAPPLFASSASEPSWLATTVAVPLPAVLLTVFAAGWLAGRVSRRR
jgi:carbon monoxide dehydrogenase subunit G